MSTLERHCRFLLGAYPAEYRELRGEEIIGTLLEATPPEKSWPRLRDIRGLVFGGLRARAMFNRQLTTRANLRTAVLAGVAAYLAYNALAVLSVEYFAEVSVAGHIHPVPRPWPAVVASALTLVPVALGFLTGKRVAVLAAALPAAALMWYAGPWYGVSSPVALHLVLLAAVVALVTLPRGGKRPSRRWLVLIGVLAVSPVVPYFVPALGRLPFGALLVAVGAVSIVWAVIDARPAIAVIVFFLGVYLPLAAQELRMGTFPVGVLPYLGILTVIGVPALWLLRRQSAHRGPPTPTS
jgi:hypothetical protein